jgi:sedoheptulose-bisphosphatase
MDKELLISLETLEQHILKAIVTISEHISLGDNKELISENQFGDTQLEIDLVAEKILDKTLQESKLVKYYLSEENPQLVLAGGDKFIVTFDPLDGSSIVNVNWAVGTIWAIWPVENDLIGQTPRKILSSGIALYGPKTTVVKYDANSQNVVELTYKRIENDRYEWIKTKDIIKITEKTKIFAPANLRATGDSPSYNALFEFWKSNKYTLRYSGGLVPDVYQIFIRQNGVFANPTSELAPAKLRFLYEIAPIAFLIEKAGGSSTDGDRSIMDIEVKNYVMKGPLCVGSSEEVQRFIDYLKKFSRSG